MEQTSGAHGSIWPEAFARVPAEEWVGKRPEELALRYDNVESHGWYDNLDPTVDRVVSQMARGGLLIDYSGGTGILTDRVLRRAPDIRSGFLIVDASEKFLRVALEKLRTDPRVAFRRIRFLKEAKRLEYLDEILPGPLLARGFDALASTNAIHLYYDLPETLRSWRRVLRPGAPVFVQSGNILNPRLREGQWIIDQTVERLQEAARALVAGEPRFAPFRRDLADPARLAAYAELRRKYFLPARPLAYYEAELRAAGFRIEEVWERPIDVRVDEWHAFLGAYHEGVLGWAGGAAKIDGRDPSGEAVALRLDLMREALGRIFSGAETFEALWTYLTCRKPS